MFAYTDVIVCVRFQTSHTSPCQEPVFLLARHHSRVPQHHLRRRRTLPPAAVAYSVLVSVFTHRFHSAPYVLHVYLGWQWLGSRVISVLESGVEGPGFKSQPRRCRETVLGKLFTPIVPLFTKQQNW